MAGDPFGGWNEDCHISASQEDILAHSHFAHQDDSPASTNSGIVWLGSSSSSSTSSSDVVTITICSAPETPETHQKDGGAGTPQPEEYKTPPEVSLPTSASSDDAGEEGSPNRKREREESESSPSKKLKDSGELGFPESNHEVHGTVVLDSLEDEDHEFEQEGGNVDEIDADTEMIDYVEERKEETERENFEVRSEMNPDGNLKLKLNLEANGNLKEGGSNLMKLVLNALKNLPRVNQEGENDEPPDIFETAKRRGMTFPRNRWYGED